MNGKTIVWIIAWTLSATGCQHPGSGSATTTRWPLIVAHRAGSADAPENTLLAIQSALSHGADSIWLSVQLSKDSVPVLYRPADLAALTQASGAVAEKTAQQLQQLNAGWWFGQEDPNGTIYYPYRAQQVPIPSLQQALEIIPKTIPVILDMKALPAARQAHAVSKLLDQLQAWQRVIIYSTDATYQLAFSQYPQARLFESRDATRARLAGVALTYQCDTAATTGNWAGFESRRELEVVEALTLGPGRSKIQATLWTKAAVACFRAAGKTHLIAFGVNTAKDYRAAACLGIDAVLADSPQQLHALRMSMTTPRQCP